MLGLTKSKDPTTETLQLLRTRETELEKARAELTTAGLARGAKPEADDEELDRLDAAVQRASTFVTRAEERFEIAMRRHEEEVQAKASAERGAAIKAAKANANKVAKEATQALGEAYLVILRQMRRFAESNIECRAAGLEDCAAEALARDVRMPEQIASEEVKDMWIAPGLSTPLPPEMQKDVTPDPQDRTRGLLRYRDAGSAVRFTGGNGTTVHLGRFRVRKSLPKRHERALPLATTIVLPPLKAFNGAVWGGEAPSDPELQLSMIDAAIMSVQRQLAASQSQDTRDDGEQPTVSYDLMSQI